jgi:hypothetical protein
MPDKLHRDWTVVDGVHVVQGWEVADAAARAALVLTAADVGRVCRQLDTGRFYILTDDVPATWEAFYSAADAAKLAGIEATADVTTTARVLAALAAAAGPVDINAQRLLDVADPVDAQDAATRAWTLAQISAQVLTTVNIGTDTTLALTHAGVKLRFTNGSQISITVPDNTSVPFPLYTVIPWFQSGAGQALFVAGAGVVINQNLLRSAGQYKGGMLHKVGTNSWDLEGSLVV